MGLEPERVTPARDRPRRRGVVALRYAAQLEHLRRAVGTRVAAVRPEPDAAARLVKDEPVARAQAAEALAPGGRPGQASSQGVRAAVELERHPPQAKGHLEPERPAVLEAAFDRDPSVVDRLDARG